MKKELWGKYKNNDWELIDTADDANSLAFLQMEYAMAYGSDWIWETR